MPWNITYRAEQPEDYRIGDMWPEPGFASSSIISENYTRDWAGTRPPLMVCLPSKHDRCGDLFLIDRYAHGDEQKQGWRVEIVGDLEDGKQPDITVQPSINCGRSYHGYIRHGVITDDCEGRTYDSD